MYDHIGLKVKNIEASVRFYTGALASLGHVLCSRDATGAGIGPKGEPALWLYLDNDSGDNDSGDNDSENSAVHVAFRAGDKSAVDRFHAGGLAAGGRDHGRPALRADYGPTYYAAFLIDPDGNNVEAVCMR